MMKERVENFRSFRLRRHGEEFPPVRCHAARVKHPDRDRRFVLGLAVMGAEDCILYAGASYKEAYDLLCQDMEEALAQAKKDEGGAQSPEA